MPPRHAPGEHHPLQDGDGVVADHQLRVGLLARPQPAARGAGAVGRVEGELPRLQLRDAHPAARAGVVLAEELRLRLPALARVHVHLHHPLRRAQRRLHRVGQPLPVLRAHHQAVHHHGDVVVLTPRQRGRALQVHYSTRPPWPARSPACASPRRGRGTPPSGRAPAAPAPPGASPPAARGSGRRSAWRSGAAPARRTPGSAASPPAPTTAAGSRRSPSPSPPSSAGCGPPSSARSRSPARAPRWRPRPASPSTPGTAARTRRGSPRSAADPRRRWCRRPAMLFPLPLSPVITVSRSRGMRTSMPLRLCSRAPRTTRYSRPPSDVVFITRKFTATWARFQAVRPARRLVAGGLTDKRTTRYVPAAL